MNRWICAVLVVSKIHSDGSSKRVYGLTTANASGFDSSTPGEKRVMIQYQGNWCTFDVMVKATHEKSSGFYRVIKGSHERPHSHREQLLGGDYAGRTNPADDDRRQQRRR